jgi:hypothetical protein
MAHLVAFAAVAGAAVIVALAATVHGRIKRHGPHVLAWRWLTGQPWHGKPHTNATWSRPGDKALTEAGYARRFWYRPGRQRAAWRTGGTLAVALAASGLWLAPWLTLGVLAALAWLGEVAAVRAAVIWWDRREHWRQWVQPAHLAAAAVLELAAGTDPGSYLHITRDRSRVTVQLPRDWSGANGNGGQLVKAVTSRLAIEQPEVKWSLAGPKPRLEIGQSAPPPARVSLADAMPAIDQAADDAVVWGLGKKSAPVTSSLSGDSPHLGLSMGSGAGKSVTARTVLAQLLYKGAIGIILDFKMISHHWAHGLSNVAIVRRPAEIHDMLVWLGGEVQRRNEVAFAGAGIDGTVNADVGPRIMVVAEELNATIAQLKAHWRKIKPKGGPDRSPALDALDMVSFTGRQVRAHILYIGQRLSDKATGGGGDARENIGVIVFGRWRATTWKMLAPDFPMPAKNLTPGRVQVVGSDVRECQAIYMTEQEARALATSGTVSCLPYGMPGATSATGAVPGGETASGLCDATDRRATAALPVAASLTLREAVENGLLGDTTLAAARTLRARDDDFPAPIDRDGKDHRYAIDDLIAYTSRKEVAA